MKTIIIYSSWHHNNTEKIAEAMADVLKAKAVKTKDADISELAEYDLLGFGSGIYAMRADKKLIELINKIPLDWQKNAFVFTTSGMGTDFSKSLEKLLIKRRITVIGRFDCKGFETWGPFKLKGGINKGKPDETDILNAKAFARELLAMVE